ncbi:hypothetical protein JHD49_08480 [Sulfurimonas sp. SAG-AH-194-C21]|nr:hypothetical protein [Sulfurimonas sp. SAG-AH-194-C21]MDF1883971.1 hypothetical protein [Sulfurimonas sp. SAG-AH-194-C21]
MQENVKTPYIEHNKRQHTFIKYTFAVLVDLTVLNLFAEYWDYVTISSFTVSLVAAIFLQFLLQVTLNLEHKVASYFKKQDGFKAKFLRVFSAWGILFISKLIMLKAIEILFPLNINFSGPIHGAVSFIAVIITMILAEQVIVKINQALRDKPEEF